MITVNYNIDPGSIPEPDYAILNKSIPTPTTRSFMLVLDFVSGVDTTLNGNVEEMQNINHILETWDASTTLRECYYKKFPYIRGKGCFPLSYFKSCSQMVLS